GTNTKRYVADSNNHTVRQVVIATGAVTTLAGSAGIAGTVDGTGSSARFNQPNALWGNGTNLYVAEYAGNTIRKVIIASRAVSTFAGSGALGFTDGTGTAAEFATPTGISGDATNLYIAERASHAIRKIVIATTA